MFLASIFLGLVACRLSVASEGSSKGDSCTHFDTCKAGGLFRTCSCDGDCYKSGTCCSDAKNFELMSPEKVLYSCSTDKAVTPVFAKTKCSKSYDGHDIHLSLCEDPTNDPADVLGNVLYTGSKSKKTYWNKHCAICNKEDSGDLKKWTVQVVCPSNHGQVKFSKYAIEKNLTFDFDSGEWGMVVQDGFLACSVHFIQPSSMIGKLDYCTPNIISKCPEGTTDAGLTKNCLLYHAERRQKSSGQYFKNSYCAQCHGVAEEDLECVGHKYGPLGTAKDDTLAVTFDSELWLVREGDKMFKCSPGNGWDPYANACRKNTARYVLWNKFEKGAQAMVLPYSFMALVGSALVNKYLFF